MVVSGRYALSPRVNAEGVNKNEANKRITDVNNGAVVLIGTVGGAIIIVFDVALADIEPIRGR